MSIEDSPKEIGNQPITPDQRIDKLEQRIAFLEAENADLKECIDWDKDPEVRKLKRSQLISTAGSLGWLTGAFGSMEVVKYVSWSALPIQDNQAAITIQQILAGAAGFAVFGKYTEQAVRASVVNFYRSHLKRTHQT